MGSNLPNNRLEQAGACNKQAERPQNKLNSGPKKMTCGF